MVVYGSRGLVVPRDDKYYTFISRSVVATGDRVVVIPSRSTTYAVKSAPVRVDDRVLVIPGHDADVAIKDSGGSQYAYMFYNEDPSWWEDPEGERKWNLAKIDFITGEIVKRDLFNGEQGLGPEYSCLSPDGTKLAFVDSWLNRLWMFDTTTDQLVWYVALSESPYCCCWSPNGLEVFVSTHSSGWIWVVDVQTAQVIDTIDIGRYVFQQGTIISELWCNNAGTKLYFGNASDYGKLVVVTLDSHDVLKVNCSAQPGCCVISNDDSKVYVGSQHTQNGHLVVDVFDTASNTFVDTIELIHTLTDPGYYTNSVYHLRINKAGTRLFALCFPDYMVVVDIATKQTLYSVNNIASPDWILNFDISADENTFMFAYLGWWANENGWETSTVGSTSTKLFRNEPYDSLLYEAWNDGKFILPW